LGSTLLYQQQPGGAQVVLDGRSTTGNVFFVHSGTGTNGAGYGRDTNKPFATIGYALSSDVCTANKGDVIYVMPGHAESIAAAAGFDADIAGVSIIGLGNGTNRPTLTFTTSTAASVVVSAANVTIKDIRFVNDIDSQVLVLDINAANCTVENCVFLEGSSKQFLTAIDVNGGSANACDITTIRRCQIWSTAVGANNGIELGEVADRVLIEDCEIYGDFADACIHNPTGKVLTRLRIRRCSLVNLQSGDHAIELVSACTGVIEDNRGSSTLADVGDQTGIDPGSCFCNENYFNSAIDQSGVLNPVVDPS
jgi:hypothetical protein